MILYNSKAVLSGDVELSDRNGKVNDEIKLLLTNHGDIIENKFKPELAMTKDKALKIAQEYMMNRGVEIVLPGKIGESNGDELEVIFLNPLSLEPDTIVCPPDNRVWVNTETGEVTWIEQM